MSRRYRWASLGALLLSHLLFSVPTSAKEPPTFARDVAPILRAACVSCHSPGKPAPFSLLTYNDAHRRARQLVQVTQSGYMPPWKTETKGFHGERYLSEADKALLKRWVDEGTVEGEKLPPPAAVPTVDWPLGPPDRIVTMPGAYVLSPNTPETTRCFLLPALSEARTVRAIAFRPSNPRIVRSISLYADTTGQGRKQAQLSGAVGYFGFTGGLFPSPAGSLADDAPGAVTLPLPSGYALRLTPKTDLILQVRFHPTGKAETERMQVGLYYARETVAQEPVTLRLGSAPLYLPRQSTAVLTDSHTLPVAAQVMEIVPNAHFVAQTVTVTAVLPDGSTLSLLTITDWDANWKQPYRLKKPLLLPAGTQLDLKITFNNTEENPRNPWNPSHRIVPGLEFMEEMSSVWLRLLPATPADRAALVRTLPAPRHQPKLAIEEREPEGSSAKPRTAPPLLSPPRSP